VVAARPDVSVLTSGHDVADARLHREVAAMHRAGLSVEVLGLGDASAGPPHARVETVHRGGLGRRALRSVVLPWKAAGRVLVTLDPELVPAAWATARLLRRPLVVDLHEDYGALLADRSWSTGVVGKGAHVVVRAATSLSRRADLTVVADEQVPPSTARDRLVVRNLPDLDLLPEPAERDGLRALYVGDVRSSRGLFTMVDAVAATPPWSLDMVGPVAAEDAERLAGRLAGDADLADRVRLHGRLPPRQAWAKAAGAAVGMVLLDPTPAFVGGLPSKLYEYLACGLAVLATPLPRQKELVEATGAGRVVADAGAAAAVLDEWARDPDSLDACRAAARRWAGDHRGDASPYAELADRVRALLPR
jgi:glycosyltransferase involved in cell wall biosynthesis